MAKDGDDFTAGVVTRLSDRVGGVCSNPDCERATKGAHSEADKVLNVGVGCHINAAREGGPRYDPDQTPQERSSIANGVWLCGICSRLVDGDPGRFPAELLRKWKADAELRAATRIGTSRGESGHEMPGVVQRHMFEEEMRIIDALSSGFAVASTSMIDATMAEGDPRPVAAQRLREAAALLPLARRAPAQYSASIAETVQRIVVAHNTMLRFLSSNSEAEGDDVALRNALEQLANSLPAAMSALDAWRADAVSRHSGGRS